MANFHLNVTIIKRSTGRSAVAAAAYRAGEKIKNERDGVTHNFGRKLGVVHTELLLPAGAPKWTRAEMWNAAEAAEKRADAQPAREIEISLPRELSLNDQIKLAREFALANFVSKGMCADICVHDKNDGNPHAHIMLTMRPVENGSFSAKKNRDWNRKELIEEWRADYCQRENATYKAAGFNIVLDHRSYKRQGIDVTPQLHMGHKVKVIEKKAAKKQPGNKPVTRIGQANAEIIKHNAEINELMLEKFTQLGKLRESLIDEILPEAKEQYITLHPIKLADEKKLWEKSMAADKQLEAAENELTRLRAESYEIKNSWWQSKVFDVNDDAINTQSKIVEHLTEEKNTATHNWAAAVQANKDTQAEFNRAADAGARVIANQSPAIKAIDLQQSAIGRQMPYFAKAAAAHPSRQTGEKTTQLTVYDSKQSTGLDNWSMLSEFEKEKRMHEAAQRER